ncbi:acetyltransferase [Peribacillus psychrosaccharolyticus]|uniref:Acetyltransferase n=2 Tax=Peribacillus psychrosaccharolyticus TaxID=1407 RepID=A0A974NKX9_PERPY|nr:acetyltransferase [Peribacillus psychrosaccharolyticus]MEC2054495.1 acetyltransferase [Peribacillus psychrosaccharolyticus]MED3744278.1 acetyltransferase [Peribacillus psychrosaccharolyticus]QQS99761.1 acetyltransferase [Peribacillus psychrosaccharolyticus]
MKNKLLIIGASGHGKVVADIALKMNKWKSVAFLDDNENIESTMGIEVIGKSSEAVKYLKNSDIFVGVGNNNIREKIQRKLEAEGASIPIIIHPTSVIGNQVELSSGIVVMAGAVINCCSKIGKGCIINTGATIDHDNIIEEFVHISPGTHLAGTVRIGKSSWLGIGSIVNNNINITSNCKIGSGTVVVKNITEAGTYIGVPARRV